MVRAFFNLAMRRATRYDASIAGFRRGSYPNYGNVPAALKRASFDWNVAKSSLA